MKRLLLILLCIGTFLFSVQSIYAADATDSGDWIKDDAVTFLGRGANRAQSFMDWTLTNYKWNYDDGPLTDSWKPIRNIVYTMAILAVLATAFLIIIKGNQGVSVAVFIKEFIIALLLVTFSYALARLFFQMADIFQLFFFKTAGTGDIIMGKDIINISIPEDFIGYRRNNITYNEPAFISLLLVQLSSITFYVIGSILTVRKIILWFFLVSAPLYPILVIFKPIKITGRIWIQELLRWLLYGPLFALFLAAIVIIWKKDLLNLPFSFGSSAVNYPTATSILIGGPGQSLSLTNSLNYNDTFIQYVVALLMLWIAILMPFILLQILLGFLAKHEFESNPVNNFIDNVRNNANSFLKKSPPPSPPIIGPHSGGLARELPKYKVVQGETNIKNQTFNDATHKVSNQNLASNTSSSQASNTSSSQASNTSHSQANQNIRNSQQAQSQTNNFSEQQHQTSNISHSQNTNTSQTNQNARNYQQTSQFTNQSTNQSTTKTQLKPDILSKATTKLINFSIPNMSDIVKFETARLSHTKNISSELKKTEESLKKIANPKVSSNPVEEDKFISLQEELNQETAKGDVLAESILSAAIVVRKPSDAKKGEVQAPVDLSELPTINLPTVNQIQTVSFEDYEAVKNLWLENYQQSDIPEQSSSRKSWIEDDIQTVSQAITLLSSSDSTKVNEGLSSVSDILPFFLIGGFSQTEIIAYLKAKSTAAKLALIELAKKEENQNTLLKKTAQKTSSQQLTKEAEIVKEEVKR